MADLNTYKNDYILKLTDLRNKMQTANNKISQIKSDKAKEDANKYTQSEIKTVNDSISLKVNANDIISAINLSPEKIKIMAKFLELNGATSFISNNTTSYAKIVDACYSIWTENVRSMYMGGWKGTDNKFIPVFYMGKNGFNAESSDVDGTYFSMTHDGKKQYLGARNKFTGGWSTIEFDAENQVINFIPESKCYTNKPFHFANGVHCVNPTNNTITSALTHDGLYANRITAYSGDTIYLAKNVAFENGSHAFTCNKIYIDTLLCNSDAKFWGYAYSSFKPVKESSGTSYLGTADDRWNRAYKKQADDISSDVRLKENIEYIQNDNVKTPNMQNDNITTLDMYNFIKDDLNLAKYNYINENNTTVGFVAQDIEKTKVGSEFIHSDDKGYLSYDSGAYVNVLAGALKKAIKKIEALENRLNEIENLKG